MLKVSIFPLTFEDISKVVAIENQCFSCEAWSIEAFKEALNSELNYFICAKTKNEVIGFAGMYFILDEGYVYNIAVDEEFQGRGVATQMLNHLLTHSKRLNLKFVSLEVRKSNVTAIKLYKKCGFKECGLRNGFYDSPKEDALIMTNFLKGIEEI